MENDEKRRIVEALTKGGSVSIGQLSIGDNNTLNYYAKGKATPAREVTFDDAIEAAKKCSMYVYAQAAVSVFYAVCRDVYHCSWCNHSFPISLIFGVLLISSPIINTSVFSFVYSPC